MDFISQMAEERIKQAIADGDFDQLEGKGKPQRKDPLAGVPEDLRMSYRIMKNSGYLPEEAEINKELISLRDLLNSCTIPEEQTEIRKRISEKEIQFQLLMDKRKWKQNRSVRKYSNKLQRLF